jgi:Domain of unknown function (DUF3291)
VTYHLAHVNIAWMHAAVHDEEMSGFAARIDEINALAEHSPGFVWRIPEAFVTPATLEPFEADFPGFQRDRLLYNMSVWQSVNDLHSYTFGTAHAELLNQRHQWIDRIEGASVALWWVPEGTLPTIAESVARLRLVRQQGPTQEAFTLRVSFPPP